MISIENLLNIICTEALEKKAEAERVEQEILNPNNSDEPKIKYPEFIQDDYGNFYGE